MVIRRLKKISDSDKAVIIKELKSLLLIHDEIVFALLYGSMVDSVAPETYGDIDLAIYVRPDQLSTPEYILESQIEAEAYRLLSNQGLNFPPVEILVMNNAPYSFLIELFKGKYMILKEDEEALTDFIEEVGGKSMVNSYFRSESLKEVVGG